MKKLVILISIVICLPLFAGVSSPFYKNPDFSLFTPFNTNQLNIHHSYTFQSGVNSSGNGYYMNTYTNHIDFQLHPKLDLKLNLNFVNFGSMNISSDFDIEGNNDNNSKIIPEFELIWKPNENMKISFSMNRPGYGYSYFFDNEYDLLGDE